MRSLKNDGVLLAALGILAASVFWGACGSSGGGGGGGGGTPPTPPPPPLPTSSEGWTVLTPSADTRMVYVSDSDGDDGNDGLTPATPKATLSAGKALMRTGFPDWLNLKAGDTWTGQDFGNWNKSGRSSTELMVITSYDTGARPFVRTGNEDAFNMFSTTSHVALVGIRFQAHTYTGTQSCTGIQILSTVDDLLIEDCFIEGYKDNLVIQASNGPGTITNVRMRRCVVVDAYSGTSSHSQGIYVSQVNGLLIEECVFDHNGWIETGAGPATLFNHNTYINSSTNVILRGNLILRSSSIGNKFSTESGVPAGQILVENNFYIEGEIGISCGGNENGAFRFTNVTIRDNVMMHIGRSQPTNRDLAFYVDVQDWDGGSIQDNLFLYQPFLTTSYGISLAGETERQISISGNLFYGLQEMSVDIDVTNTEADISVIGNEFQDGTEGSQLVVHSGGFGEVTYQDNTYFSSAAASDWFSVNGSDRSYAEWLTLSGETGSTVATLTYPDPGRDETTYQASLGGTPTLAAFVAEVRQQSKAFWRPAYTAAAINDYIRAGYGR